MRAGKAQSTSQSKLSPAKDAQSSMAMRRDRVDSQPDSGASNFAEPIVVASPIEADNRSSELLQEPQSPGAGERKHPVLPAGLDVEYVRRILLKYLEYLATGENEKEALTLEKVLFTVLDASP